MTSDGCKNALPKESNAYFLFYFDDPNYTYSVKRIDLIIEDIEKIIYWNNYKIEFLLTPGHTDNSIIILLGNNLFTGDTIMQCKPFIFKRCSKKEILNSTINNIVNLFSPDTLVYPGHGEQFLLSELFVK